jgi:hypothetical protein
MYGNIVSNVIPPADACMGKPEQCMPPRIRTQRYKLTVKRTRSVPQWLTSAKPSGRYYPNMRSPKVSLGIHPLYPLTTVQTFHD